MKRLLLLCLLFLLSGHFAFAQGTITGTVSNSEGQPLVGATVMVENTTTGALTNEEGRFSIKASAGQVLVISYIGFTTTRVTVGDQTDYRVEMEENTTTLDEIVLVGYGQQKKVNLTGAVETVTFREEVNQPVTNSGQLLYGRFSGVQLTQSSGNPGADGSSIVIRGIGTFGNSTPLIVIDNIQYDNLTAFNNLAPSDIESITVLKDASASAIYGARGANGVILVTTRRGAEGTSQISYNGYYGIQEATVVPVFLNATDYAQMMNEKYRNEDGVGFIPRYTEDQLAAIQSGSLPDQFANTSWADEVLQQAGIQNHNLSLSGGNKKSSYRLSMGYMGQDAIVKSKFKTERYNLSFNINSDLKDWFSLNSVTNSYWRRIEGPTGGQNAFSGDNGIIYSFQRAAPTIPAYYSNGEYGIVDGAYLNDNASFLTQNPLRRGFLGNYESDQINLSHRTALEVQFTEDLSFETSGSANVIFANVSDFSPRAELNDWEGNVVTNNQLNSLQNSANFQYRLLNENILKFNRTLAEAHNVGVLLGHSISYFKSDNFTGRLSGFPTDNLEEFNGGGVVDPTVSGGAFEEAYQSFFWPDQLQLPRKIPGGVQPQARRFLQVQLQ
jgi:TonB-linked SusC/RagA family outer membrane protein